MGKNTSNGFALLACVWNIKNIPDKVIEELSFIIRTLGLCCIDVIMTMIMYISYVIK